MKATTMHVTSLLLLSLLHPLHCVPPPQPSPAATATAVLAFGDSTFDSGNNNYLPTTVRANHPPNGVDFPGHLPTGRYSNGELIPDILASALRLKPTLPAYLDPSLTLTDLSTGVNFASAGAGLDDLTSESARVLTIGRQVEMLEEYKGKLRGAMGDKKAEEIVNGAVVVVSIGSNDLMNNYYVSDVRRREYSLEAYHGLMLQRMKYLVERIYKLGGRRIAIAGLPPLGCLPFVMTLAAFRWDAGHALGQRVCVDQKNAEAAAYNARLQDLINTMPTSFKGAKIAYADTYTPMLDMMKNPSKYGFTEANRGCCGTGTFEMGPTCMFPFPTCPDPSKFMFWDSVHPTTATYTFLANGLVKTALPKITR